MGSPSALDEAFSITVCGIKNLDTENFGICI